MNSILSVARIARMVADSDDDPSATPWPTTARRMLQIVAFAVLLFIAAAESFWLARGDNAIGAIWFSNALQAALMLRCRTARWPELLVAGAVANCTANLVFGDPFQLAAALSLCNALDVLICVAMTRWFAVGRDFASTRNLLVFFFAALGPGPILSSSLAAIALRGVSSMPFLQTAQVWYSGDVLGYFCLAPILLTATRSGYARMWRTPRLAGSLVTLGLAMTTLAAVYLQSDYPLAFLIVIPVVAAAFLADFEGVALAVALSTLACVLALHNGVGTADFGDIPELTRIRLLQLLLSVSSFSGFMIAAQLRERAQVSSALTQLRVFVDGASDYAICMLDQKGRILSWNTGAERIRGYREEDVIGRHYSLFEQAGDAALPDIQTGLELAARQGSWERTVLSRRHDGGSFWADEAIHRVTDANGRLIGFASLTRDVTERHNSQQALERARAALAQAQKMEAVGQLTGGMAHDFNNYLTVIRGNAEMLVEDLERTPKQAQMAQLIVDTSHRAADLTRSLLAFSRKQVLEPRTFDINESVRGMALLIRRSVPESVELHFDLASRPALAFADEAQLQSALLNIVVNARDALAGKGAIFIETELFDADDTYAEDDLPAGPLVCLAVSDTGSGMTPETMERAVEPFFTTKAGQGSGLGLSMVYGFAQQSQGALRLYSEPGVGTTVRLYLPMARSDAQALSSPSPENASAGKGERVLVVEDNEPLRDMLDMRLKRLGYQTILASNGGEALDLVRGGLAIDLVISDVVMPKGMNGPQLAEELVRIAPNLPVILTSGYARSLMEGTVRPPNCQHFLAKPYGVTQLRSKIRQALMAGAGQAVRP